MGFYWIRVNSKSDMTGILIKKGKFGPRDAQGIMPCEDQAEPAVPRAVGNHQKPGGQHGPDSFSEPPAGSNTVDNLRAVREYISVVLSSQFVVFSYGSPRKPIHLRRNLVYYILEQGHPVNLVQW